MSRKKRRGKKRNNPAWQERKARAEVTRPTVDHAAQALGCTLRVNEVQAGRTTFPHWMFKRGGRTVLWYWPTKKKWRAFDGLVGFVEDPLEVADPLQDALFRLARAPQPAATYEQP